MARKDDSKRAPKSDTRNVVSAEASDSIDFEDRLALLWEDNKKLVIYGIFAIFAIFAIYYIIRFAAHRSELSVQSGYAAVTDSSEKREWAEGESGHPLSGFAYKQLADEAYEEGDFAKAVELYEEAAQSSKSAIKDAASLGLAISHLQLGNTAEARAVLDQLANDDEATNQTEALYRLASISSGEKDFAAAREYVERIQANATRENFYWLQKSLILQNDFPPEETADSVN